MRRFIGERTFAGGHTIGGRRRQRRFRKAFAAGAALALGFVANLVFAEWLANGTGEGYARAGQAQALTTGPAQPLASLYPGGTGDLALTVRNPNPFPVSLISVDPNGDIVANDAACGSLHGVSFEGYTGNHTLAPNSTTELVLEDVLVMDVSSSDDCQGAVLRIPVSLNGGTSTGPSGSTWYIDADGDSFGDPSTSVVAESAPVSYVANGTDCDDNEATVYPGADEVPDDAMDNDCDGIVDGGPVD